MRNSKFPHLDRFLMGEKFYQKIPQKEPVPVGEKKKIPQKEPVQMGEKGEKE